MMEGGIIVPWMFKVRFWGNPLTKQEVEDHEYSFGWIHEKFYREEPTNDSYASDVQSRGCSGGIWMAAGDC